MGRKIIVTGYGPFLSSAEDRTPIKHDINASWEVAKALKANWAESTDLRFNNIKSYFYWWFLKNKFQYT